MERLKVFSAAKIRTMDPGRPEANAVAVSDDRIVSVGTLESMRPWLRRLPHEIDDSFADRVLMPGFVDPHTHLRLSGTYMGLNYVGPIDSTDMQGNRVRGLVDRAAVLERLGTLVAERSMGEGEPVVQPLATDMRMPAAPVSDQHAGPTLRMPRARAPPPRRCTASREAETQQLTSPGA